MFFTFSDIFTAEFELFLERASTQECHEFELALIHGDSFKPRKILHSDFASPTELTTVHGVTKLAVSYKNNETRVFTLIFIVFFHTLEWGTLFCPEEKRHNRD